MLWKNQNGKNMSWKGTTITVSIKLIYVLCVVCIQLFIMMICYRCQVFLFLGCRTISTYNLKTNPAPNKKCVFPFMYEGKTFTSCTTYKNKGTPWCATEVSSKGKYLKNKWGVCDCSRMGKKCNSSPVLIFLTWKDAK